MTSGRHHGSDGIRCQRGINIPQLALEFDIHPGMLEPVLAGAAGLLRASRENVHPADKKALRGVAKTLAQTIDRLSGDAVRERLVEAVFQEPDGPDDDGLAYYTAWCAARARIDRAIAGARDLLALVRAGEAFKIPSRRPPYDHWTVAIGSLLEFWTDDLGREVTISDHASDPRGVKPSQSVRFVHQCMQLLGEEMTEQACRTVLYRLRVERPRGLPFPTVTGMPVSGSRPYAFFIRRWLSIFERLLSADRARTGTIAAAGWRRPRSAQEGVLDPPHIPIAMQVHGVGHRGTLG